MTSISTVLIAIAGAGLSTIGLKTVTWSAIACPCAGRECQAVCREHDANRRLRAALRPTLGSPGES
jgi:hypothetical protein